mgnify:CR=1 FL=1
MANLTRMSLATSVLLLSTTAYAETPMTSLRVCADPGNMPLSNTQGEGFQNKIAEVIAKGLGTQVTYFYRPYLERGLTRQTFKNNSCDVLMGMSPDNERMITTTPLYKSTFVLASRADKNYDFKSLDDPRLKELSVGVFQHSAIRTELMEHGVSGTNVKLHVISHNADLKPERQPTKQVQRVIDGNLDVAGVWGPFAGWYNTDSNAPLSITPLNSWDTKLPMEFDLSIGLKKTDQQLKAKIEQVLQTEKDAIKQVLVDYGVPLVECNHCIVSGELPSHGKYQHQEAIIAKYQPTKQSDKDSLPSRIDQALAAGSSLNAELLNAVLAKDFARIDYLLERGADINANDTNGLTPLMNAVKGGNYELVKRLLAHDADADALDNDHWTALMHAAWLNEPKMIRTIAAGYGAKVDLIEKLSHNTALGLAVQKGKTLAVVALLDSSANPNITMGKAEYTPLMLAANLGHLPAAQVLLQYKAEVDMANSGGVTALMIAAANDNADLFSLILKSGADPFLKNGQGKTAFDIATRRGAEQVLEMYKKFHIKTAQVDADEQ